MRDLAKEMGKERERERERESHIPSSYMSPSPTSSAPLSPATSISASMQASMSTLSNGSTALTSTTMSTDPSLGAGAGADAGLDAALARAEERSKLKRDSRCDVCGKKVVNAPISRSGSTFCGRECRIEAKRRAKEVKEAMKLDGRKKTKVEERKNEVVGGVEQQRPVAGAGAAKEEGREENGRR